MHVEPTLADLGDRPHRTHAGVAGRDARLRVFFLAHPVGGARETTADDESLGAACDTSSTSPAVA